MTLLIVQIGAFPRTYQTLVPVDSDSGPSTRSYIPPDARARIFDLAPLHSRHRLDARRRAANLDHKKEQGKANWIYCGRFSDM